MWFKLTGDQRITERCATEGCGGQVTWRLEAGGIGSNYCSGCKAKIDQHLHSPPSSRSEEASDADEDQRA